MRIALRVIFGFLFFLAVEIVIFLPLFLLGLICFPLVNHFAARELAPSNINSGQYVIAFKNKFLNEWLGNREDGLLPDWWQAKGGTAFTWFLRNPICNMRFWPVVSTLPNPEKLICFGTLDHIPEPDEDGWFLVLQGPYVGFLWQGAPHGAQATRRGVWVGYKTNPRDKKPNCIRDYRWFGLGTAFQVWGL